MNDKYVTDDYVREEYKKYRTQKSKGEGRGMTFAELEYVRRNEIKMEKQMQHRKRNRRR